MFGTKKYQKEKSIRFKSDNERKQYFAILNYYKKQNSPAVYSKQIKNKIKTSKYK